MKLLQSNRVSLPILYLIEDESELLKLPFGVPYIRNSIKVYDEVVRLLEFQVLLKSAIATRFPFNWKKLLEENGFGKKISREVEESKVCKHTENEEEGEYVGDFIESTMYIVDVEYLKNLKILPTWFTDIETAVKENIMNSILYNPSLYNKKLDLCSGSVELSTPEKNLIIIDISSSIPKAISKAVLLLAKTMASQFYADLLITGSKSTLYDYTEMDRLDVTTIYSENEQDNDQIWFLKLINIYRKYNTVINFGDSDYAGHNWQNTYNSGTKRINEEEGKKLNKWEVNQIIDFHTRDSEQLSGYVRWFTCSNIEQKKKWVHYLA